LGVTSRVPRGVTRPGSGLIVTPVGFSVAHTKAADWPGCMDAGCARKSVMRAGGAMRCWMAPDKAGLGGAAAGGACAAAQAINSAVSAKLGVNRMVVSYFFSKNLL
jgi:hypothetical protein